MPPPGTKQLDKYLPSMSDGPSPPPGDSEVGPSVINPVIKMQDEGGSVGGVWGSQRGRGDPENGLPPPGPSRPGASRPGPSLGPGATVAGRRVEADGDLSEGMQTLDVKKVRPRLMCTARGRGCCQKKELLSGPGWPCVDGASSEMSPTVSLISSPPPSPLIPSPFALLQATINVESIVSANMTRHRLDQFKKQVRTNKQN